MLQRLATLIRTVSISITFDFPEIHELARTVVPIVESTVGVRNRGLLIANFFDQSRENRTWQLVDVYLQQIDSRRLLLFDRLDHFNRAQVLHYFLISSKD